MEKNQLTVRGLWGLLCADGLRPQYSRELDMAKQSFETDYIEPMRKSAGREAGEKMWNSFVTVFSGHEDQGFIIGFKAALSLMADAFAENN
jgi:hypothetical protein